MSKKAYKRLKVFDCQDMPDDLSNAFLRMYESTGNDCYVDYEVDSEDPTEMDEITRRIRDWFVENGAKPGSSDRCGEHVIVKYWW